MITSYQDKTCYRELWSGTNPLVGKNKRACGPYIHTCMHAYIHTQIHRYIPSFTYFSILHHLLCLSFLPGGMITSHKACRKGLQNLRFHSAEHYIQTCMHTYMHTIFSHVIFLCHTRSFTYNFVPRNSVNFSILQHLLCLHTHTPTPHTQPAHNLSPHNFLTHTTYTLLHTPILHHLFSLSCISHAIFTFLLQKKTCWKKLTCGVIRPFIFLNI